MIFCEHLLGHPSLASRCLPHGVSIYSCVAGELVPVSDLSPPSQLDNTAPLDPLPLQQSIARLLSEPARVGSKWINVTPDDMAQAEKPEFAKKDIRVLRQPQLAEIALPLATPHLSHQFSPALINQCFKTLLSAEQLDVPLVSPLDVPRSFAEAQAHPRAKAWCRAMEV